MRILRLVKLLKLLRLLKLSKVLDALQDEFPVPMGMAVVSKACMLTVLTLYIGHFIGCLWYAVGLSSRLAGHASWLDKVASLDDIGTANATASMDSVGEAYVASLYWSFTTMTTVGYGDFTPDSVSERLFAVFAMMVSAAPQHTDDGP